MSSIGVIIIYKLYTKLMDRNTSVIGIEVNNMVKVGSSMNKVTKSKVNGQKGSSLSGMIDLYHNLLYMEIQIQLHIIFDFNHKIFK